MNDRGDTRKRKRRVKMMESMIRKCLNEREKSFGSIGCPGWLNEILPYRFQSLDKPREVEEEDDDNDEDEDESSRPIVDLHPYQLVDRIPLLTSTSPTEKISSNNTDEYPHDESFLHQHFSHLLQLICSPSREQLSELLQEQRSISRKTRISSMDETDKTTTTTRVLNECGEVGCCRRSIPLSGLCERHLLKNDEKQILFDHCLHCDQLSFREDKTSRLHFCSHLHLTK